MTLEEAIKHAESKSKEVADCKCAMEHRQLAEWLQELKYLRNWKDKMNTNLKILKENTFAASKQIEQSKEILCQSDWW